MIVLKKNGQPFHQKRHRHTSRGKFVRTYDPCQREKKYFREFLRSQYDGEPLSGPLFVGIEAWYQTPKSWSAVQQELHENTWRPKTPDNDNIEKFYWDCMKGIIYEDDGLICDNRTQMRYSMNPRIVITIKPLEESTNQTQLPL